MEGRDSHFLSGPNLKKGQIQSNINHFALCSFPSTIVIEQTNGKRPVAGGNKKPFDNYRLRFLPRSSQHLHKPKGATSGCQHQAAHTHTQIFSQQHSHMHWYMNTCSHRQPLQTHNTNTLICTYTWCSHGHTDTETDRWRDTNTHSHRHDSSCSYYYKQSSSQWYLLDCSVETTLKLCFAAVECNQRPFADGNFIRCIFYQGCRWVRIGADNVLWTDTKPHAVFRNNICLCFLSPDWHNLPQTSHPSLSESLLSQFETHITHAPPQSVELTLYSVHQG